MSTGATRAKQGKRNAAGEYVHFCADCGQECTIGTPGAPAHGNLDGVTRCWKCDRAADAKRITLTARKGEQLRDALRITRDNLRTLNAARMDRGIVPFDPWLKVVEDALALVGEGR